MLSVWLATMRNAPMDTEERNRGRPSLGQGESNVAVRWRKARMLATAFRFYPVEISRSFCGNTSERHCEKAKKKGCGNVRTIDVASSA